MRADSDGFGERSFLETALRDAGSISPSPDDDIVRFLSEDTEESSYAGR